MLNLIKIVNEVIKNKLSLTSKTFITCYHYGQEVKSWLILAETQLYF